MPKIRAHVLPDGRRRYSFRVDTGRGPDGKRIQEYQTFDRKADAEKALARIQHETGQGTYVRQSRETLAEHLDGWLEGVTRDLRASTKRNYEDAFLPVRERLGSRYLQSVTKADIEALVTWMLASGRRRGGKAGTALSARSVRLTLGRLTAALESAVEEGKLPRNPARYVKPPKHTPRERDTWTKAEVRAFLAVADADRLAACWRLSLYGLRRGEVLGLRWRDVDLKAGSGLVGQFACDVQLAQPGQQRRPVIPGDDRLAVPLGDDGLPISGVHDLDAAALIGGDDHPGELVAGRLVVGADRRGEVFRRGRGERGSGAVHAAGVELAVGEFDVVGIAPVVVEIANCQLRRPRLVNVAHRAPLVRSVDGQWVFPLGGVAASLGRWPAESEISETPAPVSRGGAAALRTCSRRQGDITHSPRGRQRRGGARPDRARACRWC